MAEPPQEPQWFKSSYSGTPDNECVEVAEMPKGPWVRDSKRPEGPHAFFSRAAWATFTESIRSQKAPTRD
ncbi:DUF397 domain-containing protein [Streptomyces sp. NPDC001508]|uniref:DUF397 domain-containing protein n=1 Tax=Streptomyces sp. NPDC001508 TaxID=3154656 RepID=UPI0033239A60